MPNVPVPGSTIPPIKEIEYSYLNDPLNFVVRTISAFLQTIWETSERGLFHWTPKIEETELVITEDNPLNLDAVKHKPAIALSLGDMVFEGTSLDELVTVRASNASEHHTDLVPGNITLNCLARFQQQARFIAWQSARTIWNLRKMLIKCGVFQEIGRKIQIGKVSPAGALVQGDTEMEWCVVPVVVPFYMQWNDTVTPLANDWSGRPIHPLREIEVQFTSKISGPQPPRSLPPNAPVWGSQFATPGNAEIRRGLRPPSIKGRPINLSKPEPAPSDPGLIQSAKIK